MPDNEYPKIKGPDGPYNFFDDPNQLKSNDPTLGPPKPKEPAMALLRAFRARRGRSSFPQITREQMSEALKQRVLDPDGADQKKTALCGTAVVVRMWAYDSPAEFVKFAIDLSGSRLPSR